MIKAIIAILATAACLIMRHQRRLKRNAYLILEALRNRDFMFRLSTRRLLFGERAMQEALNSMGDIMADRLFFVWRSEEMQANLLVEGMKEELRKFLQNGGKIKVFGNCLVERQETELGYYNRTKSELETMKNSGMDAKALEALWEKRNNELRQMGVKLVPMPE